MENLRYFSGFHSNMKIRILLRLLNNILVCSRVRSHCPTFFALALFAIFHRPEINKENITICCINHYGIINYIMCNRCEVLNKVVMLTTVVQKWAAQLVLDHPSRCSPSHCLKHPFHLPPRFV